MSSDLPTEDPPADGAMSADELLPPIEPPNARFILQLFVIPAIIVTGVVLLWLLVTTLASSGAQDPEKIISSLRSSNQARWQKAMTLANTLNNPRFQQLKQNVDLAKGIAQLLDEEIDAQLTDDNSIQLRYFLCRVLGEFQVDEGLGVLLKAAREDVERDVRRQAINALAVLAGTFNSIVTKTTEEDEDGLESEPEDGPVGITLEHPELISTLKGIASEKDDLLRSQAAFALGVFAQQPEPDPMFVQELEVLVNDLYGDTRYNAALALARSGSTKAVEALIEMLDREALALCIELEEKPALQTFKRNTLLRNALDSIERVLVMNPEYDGTAMIAAVRKFVAESPDWDLAGDIPKKLIERANKLLEAHAQSPGE